MNMRATLAAMTPDEKKMAREILTALSGLSKVEWLMVKTAAETLKIAEAMKR